jgi:hypothetical protein
MRLSRSNMVLLIVIAGLGFVTFVELRKEARLQAALARYKGRAHDQLVERLDWSAKLLNWPDQSPLAEVVEQIKVATSGPGWTRDFPLGIPVAVDPIGLEHAGQSLSSPVHSPPGDPDLTLGEKLRIVLEPLGLACDVKDATLVITARELVSQPIKFRARVED